MKSIHILEPMISHQKIKDHQWHDDTVSIDQIDAKRMATPGQVLPQTDMAKQRLDHHQSGKRRQPLTFKTNLGYAVGCTMKVRFSKVLTRWEETHFKKVDIGLRCEENDQMYYWKLFCPTPR